MVMKTINDKIVNILNCDQLIKNIAKNEYGISQPVSSILSTNSNIDNDNIDDFLNPRLKNLIPDNTNLIMLGDASNEIINTINNRKKIGILSDYDVDGVTSGAILKTFLNWLNIEPIIIIPDRFTDGYGPSIKLFEKMKNLGVELIITLDCGTTAFEPIDFALNLGIKVVVIDHHISKEEKPKAAAIVNPNQIGDNSELKHLCAAGVTFLLCCDIVKKLKINKPDLVVNIPSLINLTHFAMIGSVCDMMKMKGLNRAFYRTGLEILRENLKNFDKLDIRIKNAFIGIKALMDVSGIDSIKSTYEIGFIIGPMINAGGRLDSGMIGVDLLTAKNQSEADILAKKLFDLNVERKDIQGNIVENVSEKAKILIAESKSILFIVSEDYNEGVVGIVASKIKESFNKTAIIGAIKTDGSGVKIIKASCRSADGVDIGSAVLSALDRGIILKGGGHFAAAGFSAKFDDFEKLYSFFEDFLKKQSEDSKSNAKIDIHSSVFIQELNDQMIDIKKLEPFGIENPKPNFLIKDVVIAKYTVLKEKHYKLSLRSFEKINGNYIWKNAIIFNCEGTFIADFIKNKTGKMVHVVGNIDFNEYGMSIIVSDFVDV